MDYNSSTYNVSQDVAILITVFVTVHFIFQLNSVIINITTCEIVCDQTQL